MRQWGGGALVIGALLLGTVPADAKCVPSPFKDGWLQEQEQLGGDTMDRHVGRSPTELAARLAKEPANTATSSFPDRHTARQVISAASVVAGSSPCATRTRTPSGVSPTTSRPTVTTNTVTPVIFERREIDSHHWVSCSCMRCQG